jgi:hypothetical protein
MVESCTAVLHCEHRGCIFHPYDQLRNGTLVTESLILSSHPFECACGLILQPLFKVKEFM